MDLYCGIDWAEDHRDVALVDRDGKLLARRRISDDAAGLAQLPDLIAGHGDTPEDPVPVAIETPRGLLVACLLDSCLPPAGQGMPLLRPAGSGACGWCR